VAIDVPAIRLAKRRHHQFQRVQLSVVVRESATDLALTDWLLLAHEDPLTFIGNSLRLI
jgi:hypothetical protein